MAETMEYHCHLVVQEVIADVDVRERDRGRNRDKRCIRKHIYLSNRNDGNTIYLKVMCV